MIKIYNEPNRRTFIFPSTRKTQDIIQTNLICYPKRVCLTKTDNKMTVEVYGEKQLLEKVESEILNILDKQEVQRKNVEHLILQKPKTNTMMVYERNSDHKIIEDVTLRNGIYKGLTPENAIRKDGNKAVAYLLSKRGYTALEKNAISLIGREFLQKQNYTNEAIDDMSIDNVKEIITIYKDVLKKSLSMCVHKAMYVDIEHFLNEASDLMIKSAFKHVMNELKSILQ